MKNLKKVGKDASLAEKAIQAVASGEVKQVASRTRKAPEKKAATLTKDIKLNDLVLEECWRIIHSGHGYTTYQIIDAETAVVR